MIGLADSLDELCFAFLQIEIGLAAVSGLTALTTQGDDGDIAALDGCVQFVSRELLLVGSCRRRQREGRTTVREQALLLCCEMLGVGVDERLEDLIACAAQTFNQGYRIVTYGSATEA